MRYLFAILVVLCLGCGGPAGNNAARVTRGQSVEEVVDLLGPPIRVNRPEGYSESAVRMSWGREVDGILTYAIVIFDENKVVDCDQGSVRTYGYGSRRHE